jgi:hypothetical protein
MPPGSGRGGAAWSRARCGRWKLQKSSYSRSAVTVLLEQGCGLLRQLVRVTGWLVLLTATARLLVQPHIDPGHQIAPGAGALVVLQGVAPVRVTRRQRMAAEPMCESPQPTRGQPAPGS